MIEVMSVLSAQYIGGGSNVSSSAINFSNLHDAAKLLLDIQALSGNGGVTVNYNVCETATGTFFKPAGAAVICTAHKDNTGRNIYKIDSYAPLLMPYFKLVFTNDGSSVTFNAKLIIWS